MTGHLYEILHRVIDRLRPSPESGAGTGAIYDPELMIPLKAIRRRDDTSCLTAR
jgi:hypothetical protein